MSEFQRRRLAEFAANAKTTYATRGNPSGIRFVTASEGQSGKRGRKVGRMLRVLRAHLRSLGAETSAAVFMSVGRTGDSPRATSSGTGGSLRLLIAAMMAILEKNKAPEPCGPGAKFGGGRSPLALSRRSTVGRLAFAGRRLPDATLCGMQNFRSHDGTVPTVAGWELSSEVSSPGSVASCRKLRAGRGADTPATFITFASAPLPRGRPRLLAGRWPRVTGLTSYL